MRTSVSLSAIIPVRNDAESLRQCLAGLRRSTAAPEEIIVVNDGSTDHTLPVAEEQGVTVINLDGHYDANYCRNKGASAATGDILVFLDSDVVVQASTLQRIVELFSDPRIDAIVDVYSSDHPHPNVVSEYKNLWIRYSYLKSGRHIDWIFGAIAGFRRDVFLGVGGFDNRMLMRYGGEDIELGKRYARNEHLIKLEPSVEVIHLKRHTLRTLLRNDFVRSRGFVSLASNLNQLPRSIFHGFANIYPAFVLSTLLGWPILITGVASIWHQEFAPIPLLLLLIYEFSNLPFLSYLSSERGFLFALKSSDILFLGHLVCAVGLTVGVLKALIAKRCRRA